MRACESLPDHQIGLVSLAAMAVGAPNDRQSRITTSGTNAVFMVPAGGRWVLEAGTGPSVSGR